MREIRAIAEPLQGYVSYADRQYDNGIEAVIDAVESLDLVLVSRSGLAQLEAAGAALFRKEDS